MISFSLTRNQAQGFVLPDETIEWDHLEAEQINKYEEQGERMRGYGKRGNKGVLYRMRKKVCGHEARKQGYEENTCSSNGVAAENVCVKRCNVKCQSVQTKGWSC